MRRTTFAIFGLVGAAAVGLSGCDQVKAPRDEGVCYFIGHVKDKAGKPTLKFNPVAHNVPDLEHCAVQIYTVRRGFLATGTAGDVTEGTYQGSFLFATNTEVRMSQKYDGPQFPFLVKYGEQLVAAGSVQVDETAAPGGPEQTAAVPKDLPKAPDAAPVKKP